MAFYYTFKEAADQFGSDDPKKLATFIQDHFQKKGYERDRVRVYRVHDCNFDPPVDKVIVFPPDEHYKIDDWRKLESDGYARHFTLLSSTDPNYSKPKADKPDSTDYSPHERAESLFNDGLELYEKKEFRAAQDKLRKALKILPSSEDIMYNLALVNLELKRYKSAQKLVKKIKQIDCKDITCELEKHANSMVPHSVFWSWLVSVIIVGLIYGRFQFSLRGILEHLLSSFGFLYWSLSSRFMPHILVSVGMFIGLIFGILWDKKERGRGVNIKSSKIATFVLTIWALLWIIMTATIR